MKTRGSSLAGLALTVAVLTSSFVSGARAEEKQLWAKSFLNQKAPDLVVEKWLTEKPDTSGKFVLIDFLGDLVWSVPESDSGTQRVRREV